MNMREALRSLGWLALSLAMPAAAQGPAAPPVTVAQAVVEDPGHAPIPVAIWAPAEGNGLPLVLISHGTGAGMTSHIDTARSLASAGFVVVAPMHPGDNFQDESAVGRPNWIADRSRHVGRVIDFMLARWDGLALTAAEPNPFYESWYLLPSLRLFDPTTRLWTLYWADSKSVRLDGGKVGSFDGDIGELDFEYTWDWFENVRELYRKAATQGRAVIFTVSG